MVPAVVPPPQEAPNIPSPTTAQRARGCTPRLRGPFLEKPSPRSPKGSKPTELEGRRLRKRRQICRRRCRRGNRERGSSGAGTGRHGGGIESTAQSVWNAAAALRDGTVKRSRLRFRGDRESA